MGSRIEETKAQSFLKEMLAALMRGDMETFGEKLQEAVEKAMSCNGVGGKEPERVDHVFVLGMLATLENYRLPVSTKATLLKKIKGWGLFKVATRLLHSK